MRLIAREPHLAQAARLEARLAYLYQRMATRASDAAEGPRWRQVARLSGRIAEGLADLARTAGPFRHNPRPTRIRVATLREGDLAQTAERVEAMCDAGTGDPCRKALADLVAREARTVLLPLVRMFSLAPTADLYTLWQTAAARRRVLRTLGVAAGPNGADWPDPPRPAARRVRDAPGAPAENGRPPEREWVTLGRVERVNRARRSGMVRTEDGRSAFFAARAVDGGIGTVHAGDAVRLRLRRGPLGLTAVCVENCPDPPPGP